MDSKLEFSAQAACKMLLHAVRHPHATCSGFLLSPEHKDEDKRVADEGDDGDRVIRVTEAIPISHASHALAASIEIAMNCVAKYAKEHNLSISGYYQADRSNEVGQVDVFAQRIVEKVGESFPSAILCLVSFEPEHAKPHLDVHNLIDGKLKRRPQQSFEVEENLDTVDKIVFSPEKLHRKIIDFDDHFNDISSDWTNSKVSQRIDELLVNF